MSTNAPVPYFAAPPSTYSQEYLNQIVRAFAVFAQQVNNPGDAVYSSLRLTNLPTNNQGLPTGALFQHDGFVKITQANVANVAGVSGTSGIGTVTVVIS